ncbi:MAG: VWA domain-containing protein [Hyphomicrobiaceae bacterium]|nr:VWA domain-containing protein [Hyphomicrobiaceae bacterium]
MSIIRPMKAAVGIAALSLGLSLGALVVALALSLATPLRAAELDVSAALGQSVMPAAGGKIYLRLSLKAAAGKPRESRTPVNVALVLDRSGSMQGPRIAAAKEAAEMALSRLGPTDWVSLIAYNHNVDVLAPATRATTHSDLQSAIAGLTANGNTGLYAGVVEGGREVGKNRSDRVINRVILMSDGLANVGPSTPGELADLGRKLGGEGISVTTIGLGLGYNEDLMQRLAASSDGNHAFAEKPEDLVKIFNAEFGDALSISAQDIEVIIECEKGFRPLRVLGREADIAGNRIEFGMGALPSSIERYVVIEIDADAVAGAASRTVARIDVRYRDLDSGTLRDATTTAAVRFSADAAEQEASLDADVMSKVAVQVSTENSERAVEFRDRGDVAGAKKALEDNAEFLKGIGSSYGGRVGVGMALTLKQLESKNAAAARNLDSESWGRTRKELRYDQHKAKRQQSY